MQKEKKGKEGKIGWTYAEVLQQVLGLDIDVELAALGVLGEVEGGDLGDVLILALTLLLLELEGDATDGAALDTLHQVGREAGDLVAETLRGNDSLEGAGLRYILMHFKPGVYAPPHR